MKKILRMTAAVLAVAAAAAGGAAAEPGAAVVTGAAEGAPAGMPPELLRREYGRLRASDAGREYLATPAGKRYEAAVRASLAGGTYAGKGDEKCADCEPSQEYDYNANGAHYANGAEGADPWEYYASCKAPYAFKEYRNRFGNVLWRYYERVTWCWRGGTITYFFRDRWSWYAGGWLNGWEFLAHINGNCHLENCNNRGVGSGWTSAWTQGAWRFCVSRWGWCQHEYPLVGIAVNGRGGWGAFFDHPQ